MSVKRQATTQLNHENWDQDDPVDEEAETGGFKMASKEVLEKRVIRTAKRRSQVTSDETKRSVFSGFASFNKTQPSSFDFLAKLPNSSNANNILTSKSETSAAANFTKPAISSPSSRIESISGSSTPLAKSTFGKSTGESSIFGGSAMQGTTSSVFSQSVFTTSKSANESPFKIQSTTSPVFNTDLASKSNNSNDKPATPISSNIFGASSTTAKNEKSLFSTTSNNASSEKTQIVSSSQASDKSTNKTDTQDDKKLVYYNKLKGLNESVSAWIKKHVEETPLCILTPIFRDYEKYLKEIQDEYEKSKEKTKTESTSDNKQNTAGAISSPWSTNISSSTFQTSTNMFTNNKNNVTSPEKTPDLSKGLGSTSASTNNFSTESPPSGGFSFGINPSTTNNSPFASNNTATTNGNSSAPFSFGIGKPFSFNSNVQKNEEPPTEGQENEDEPPKVEYTPIVEENSVYDKKCKIFVKKDGNFIDKGVGTLYIKKIDESGKHQLLVRANTALGNVLLNLILGSSIPTQRMGKNNVMMVCIPTPDSKPPPTSILVRVKTSEEADELLETLNKYKA